MSRFLVVSLAMVLLIPTLPIHAREQADFSPKSGAASADEDDAAPSRHHAGRGGMFMRQPWPRLDVGAVFCDTQEDLLRHAQQDDRPDTTCRVIGHATPITIVHRVSPGLTEIRTQDSDQAGWTNVWLPARAP